MMPIHELLNRIRWDEAFADAEFVIGFYDRVADQVARRPLKEVYFEKDDHYFFHFMDDGWGNAQRAFAPYQGDRA